jgi:hypothetical protein
MANLRSTTRRNAGLGFAHFARAFNLDCNRRLSYSWPKETRDEVMAMMERLIQLAEHGPIQKR